MELALVKSTLKGMKPNTPLKINGWDFQFLKLSPNGKYVMSVDGKSLYYSKIHAIEILQTN